MILIKIYAVIYNLKRKHNSVSQYWEKSPKLWLAFA